MDKELAVLKVFFDDPLGQFHIREVARTTKLNHMTVRSYLNRYVKSGLLIKKQQKIYDTYVANITSGKWKNLKLYDNLERLRESHIVEYIEKYYDYPTIILFGSYAHATDTKESDIDIGIITNVKKQCSTDKYKAQLKKPTSVHMFTTKEFNSMKKTNPELVNSICNGIVLSGQLEVV